MVPQTKISVPLTHDEFTALSSAATRELRAPRDQARFILRQALGLTNEQKNNAGAIQAANQSTSVTTANH